MLSAASTTATPNCCASTSKTSLGVSPILPASITSSRKPALLPGVSAAAAGKTSSISGIRLNISARLAQRWFQLCLPGRCMRGRRVTRQGLARFAMWAITEMTGQLGLQNSVREGNEYEQECLCQWAGSFCVLQNQQRQRTNYASVKQRDTVASNQRENLFYIMEF